MENDDDFLGSLISRAEKETGMTREQMLATPDSPAETKPQRIDRDELRRRGVPEIHLQHVYDREPEPCVALTAVQDVLGGSITLLILGGGIGTRKSGSAAYGLTRRLGRFIGSPALARISVSAAEDEKQLFNSMTKVSFLVIDDVGTEHRSDWFVSVLNDIVNRRYEELLPTILTCNLSPEAFATRYGDRILDRVRELGKFVGIGGKSMRGKKQ